VEEETMTVLFAVVTAGFLAMFVPGQLIPDLVKAGRWVARRVGR
jgi:hypothetical protein